MGVGSTQLNLLASLLKEAYSTRVYPFQKRFVVLESNWESQKVRQFLCPSIGSKYKNGGKSIKCIHSLESCLSCNYIY